MECVICIFFDKIHLKWKKGVCMLRLKSLNFIENKEESMQVLIELIDLKGKAFYQEVVEYINPLNHHYILEALVSSNKSTLILEESKFIYAENDYVPLNKYSGADVLDLFSEKRQLVDITLSDEKNIFFKDSHFNMIIKKLAEIPVIKSDISESDFTDLKEAGLIEYMIEVSCENNQISVRPISSKKEESVLTKVEDLLSKINDSIIYSTRNIKPHHVKIGVAMFGVGLAMFGQEAFAGDNDAMIRLMKVKAEMQQRAMGSHADGQLTTDMMKAISSHFKDFFHGTNNGTATIDVNSTHVGSASVEHFKIAIQDKSHNACNIEFHVSSSGDVSSKISKNDFGDFCTEAFKKSAKVLSKHFAELAKKKENY